MVPVTSRRSLVASAGLLLAAAAALMLLLRLPGAYHELTHAAKAAQGRNELGGALATADSIGLNDDFVRDAFAYVPKTGRFAVVLPKDEAAVEQKDGVSQITFDGVPALFANYLLPRRQVKTPAAETYVICFHCDVASLGQVRWLSPDNGGGRVGYIR
jgi:hypothetical protein